MDFENPSCQYGAPLPVLEFYNRTAVHDGVYFEVPESRDYWVTYGFSSQSWCEPEFTSCEAKCSTFLLNYVGEDTSGGTSQVVDSVALKCTETHFDDDVGLEWKLFMKTPDTSARKQLHLKKGWYFVSLLPTAEATMGQSAPSWGQVANFFWCTYDFWFESD